MHSWGGPGGGALRIGALTLMSAAIAEPDANAAHANDANKIFFMAAPSLIQPLG
jgi:hypothetical protein